MSTKAEKVNPVKQRRQKHYIWSFIYFGKWSYFTYLWLAKVWVHLFSIGWQLCVSKCHVLFKEHLVNKIFATLVCMRESLHKQRRFLSTSERNVAIWVGKGYKTRTPQMHSQIDSVQKDKTLDYYYLTTTITTTRSGQQTKITPKARYVIVSEVTKEPRVPLKQLKACLPLANINVHESTIRGTLKKQWCTWQSCKEKTTIPKKEHCCTAERSCRQASRLLKNICGRMTPK